MKASRLDRAGVSFAIIPIGLLSFSACMKEKPYSWNLPADIPPPVVPKENPMSEAKVELGRRLFYDVRLSQDQTMSCGSCHLQSRAFTDGKARARGIPSGEGQLHPRSAQHLGNAAYFSMLTWANPVLNTLEGQMRVPLFFTANAVKEMGLEGDEYLKRLRADPVYVDLFTKAYGKKPPEELIFETTVRFAIASFERSLMSFNSPYDKFKRGNAAALDAAQKRGMDIFFSDKTHCSECHSGFNFAESTADASGAYTLKYRNNGLYSVADYARKAANETGLKEFSMEEKEEGLFRAPSLRNVAVTFPYMHDGSIGCSEKNRSDPDACSTEALGKVIDHYMRGGKPHPVKDPLIAGFKLSPQERDDLIAFLKALTDQEFLTNPAHSDPFATRTAVIP